MLGTLAAFIGVSAVVICTPGQDTALTIRNTLAGGWRNGIATAGGVAAGQAVWTIAASLGVVAVLSASEPVFATLKLAGATYLVYLGLHALWKAVVPAKSRRACEQRANTPPKGTRRGLRQGVLSNLGNPKMAIFFASLLPQFAPGGGASFAVLLALGSFFCVMTFCWLTIYALAIHRAQRLLAGPARRVLDALAGIVLTLFGLRLAAESR
jgi:threonine/homoserine/homoserine lactone efflux protein